MKSFLSNEAISEIAEYGLYCQSRDGLDVGSLRATKASIADTCLKGFKDESAEKAENDNSDPMEMNATEVIADIQTKPVFQKVKTKKLKVKKVFTKREEAESAPETLEVMST